MITGIAHVCYLVSDLEASIDFYQGKLGLKAAFDFTNDDGVRFGIYLHVGARNFIELFKGEPVTPLETSSYSHLCLECDNLEMTVAELRANGVETTEPFLAMDESWQSWITDPDGNRIEIHQYTEKSWQAPHLR